jgi:hypothetical protein
MKRFLLIAAVLMLPLLSSGVSPIQLVTVLGSNLIVASATSTEVVVTGNVTKIILEP